MSIISSLLRSPLRQISRLSRPVSSRRLFSTQAQEDKTGGGDQKEDRVFVAGKHTVTEQEVFVESMTPKKIVEELDRYIIGQGKAKRAVSVSLRNRWRRQQLDENLRKEVLPMNILMIGPTGTGKTEIARRLAQMVDAPFVKVEATKYTEVGIVGQSAEECIKDLADKAVKMERRKRVDKLKQDIEEKVETRILARLPGSSQDLDGFRAKLRDGQFDNTKIDVKGFRLPPQVPPQLRNLGILFPQVQNRDKAPPPDRVPIHEAREIIREYELAQAIDDTEVQRAGLRRAEESGIVFLDEIDKLVGDSIRGDYKGAKGEGVQKELLGLIEGTAVQTDHGTVNTDHVLFVASGAFHQARPSDLLPELQGRLPIRVELEALTEDDFYRILTETEANLIQQQIALFSTEGVTLDFVDTGIKKMAQSARELNEKLDNIGARRLRAVISRIVEDVSFEAPDRKDDTITIDEDFVTAQLEEIMQDEDLSKYIL